MVAALTNLTAMIKAEARRLGFALVGVTNPSRPPHFEVFEGWLNAGRHGSMAYLSSERARRLRADPRQVLPGCLSVIVLGLRYPTSTYTGQNPEVQISGNNGGGNTGVSGLIASYAYGSDYHDTIPPRLRALSVFIGAQTGASVNSHPYTDTGPVLERDLAQLAGLGWIGKNTCLIHPRMGSYFLLAELFVDILLEPDPPFLADRCGTCTRCLQACPTSCILPDRTIDAGRCISYLTIELKGPVPISLRPLMGRWIFGCDICQTVCPWNMRFSEGLTALAPDPAFTPRPGLPAPDLIQELALSPQDFNRKFHGSPIQRPHRHGYLRNVAIALGNNGSPSAVPTLIKSLLHEANPLVRGASAWALGQIGDASAFRALASARSSEPDETVLREITSALL